MHNTAPAAQAEIGDEPASPQGGRRGSAFINQSREAEGSSAASGFPTLGQSVGQSDGRPASEGGELGLEMGCLGMCCPRYGDSLPTLVLGCADEEATQLAWAKRVDRLAFLYIGTLSAVILFERYVQHIMGRIWLEAICPYLELALILALTFDGRRSWTSRFCNSKQITWLGNISMSFYMTHMFGVIAVQVGQQVYFAASDVSACATYVVGEGSATCLELPVPPPTAKRFYSSTLQTSLTEIYHTISDFSH